jgi:hypothetical protein
LLTDAHELEVNLSYVADGFQLDIRLRTPFDMIAYERKL